MQIEKLTEQVSVSGQLEVAEVKSLREQGVDVLVCNRPDDEDDGQIPFHEIQAEAQRLGMDTHFIPFASYQIAVSDRDQFAALIQTKKRIHAYCRSGARCKRLWREANSVVGGEQEFLMQNQQSTTDKSINGTQYDVVIVGAGSSGIATAASIKKRNRAVRIALVDPATDHYYQPGWTMVGGGVFDVESTHRKTADLIPSGCDWIRQATVAFHPQDNCIELADGARIAYQQLIVAPGLKLDWAGVEGLEATLGKNSVTSNYRYDLAPYTWELVQGLTSGKAVFTQPPMPIKCAGAPQKAMYLSASEWLQKGRLNDIDIQFYNAGGVLFGVDAYVPALMKYVERYGAELCFSKTLIKVDGPNKTAWFKDADGNVSETQFDMLHVCPPQCAPDFIRDSELSDAAGWLDVDPATLQSTKYDNIWGCGDVMNTTNAKTMAAARKQAPALAQNIVNVLTGSSERVSYDGYGSCPLTVEHGKIVLAEFTYGGKVAPSFPDWVNVGTKPTKLAWHLKATILPHVYWHAMLKGREWMASPIPAG